MKRPLREEIVGTRNEATSRFQASSIDFILNSQVAAYLVDAIACLRQIAADETEHPIAVYYTLTLMPN